MAFCGIQFSEEVKEEEKKVDHSLKDVYAFSTKKKQMGAVSLAGVSAEGLLTMGKNKAPLDRRIKIRYNDIKFSSKSYHYLCQLRTDLPSGKRGVGSCINVNLNGTRNALTCAHNLVGISARDNLQVKYKDGYVYEARQGENTWKRLLKLDDDNIRVHPKFNGHADCGFDIGVCPTAVLTVNDDDSVWLKSLKKDSCCHFANPEDLKGMKIELSGYPGEKCGHPYTHTGVIADATKTSLGGYLLWYTADASPGNSGSPIRILDENWIKNNIKTEGVSKVTIGIHTGHDETAGLNFGTLLTPAIMKWMKREPENEGWGTQIYNYFIK